jgi:RNase P subunit RPR2
MLVECHSCHTTFQDYKSLAKHIMANKKGHRQGKRWAAKYVMINGLSAKNRTDRQLNGRVALTEEQKETRDSLQIELSGNIKRVNTYCPKCKQFSTQSLPVEYTNSERAWRVGSTFVITCERCNG